MKIKSVSTSDACQDDFVLKMLNYQEKGYFVDLGAGGPRQSSNSYRLEELEWNGICIDLNTYLDYELRRCDFFAHNALDFDYVNLFEYCNAPSVIDYLSLDIDENSTDLLKLMPFDRYKFKIITIEHDAYIRDPEFRSKQREILFNNDYYSLCADVWPDIARKQNLKGGPFEDWWVKKEFFEDKLLDMVKCENLYGSDIIRKFGFSSAEII